MKILAEGKRFIIVNRYDHSPSYIVHMLLLNEDRKSPIAAIELEASSADPLSVTHVSAQIVARKGYETNVANGHICEMPANEPAGKFLVNAGLKRMTRKLNPGENIQGLYEKGLIPSWIGAAAEDFSRIASNFNLTRQDIEDQKILLQPLTERLERLDKTLTKLSGSAK